MQWECPWRAPAGPVGHSEERLSGQLEAKPEVGLCQEERGQTVRLGKGEVKRTLHPSSHQQWNPSSYPDSASHGKSAKRKQPSLLYSHDTGHWTQPEK